MFLACQSAYNVRLFAINTYGRLIHEFDPWFNMRATQYLFDKGWTEFFTWFDHMSWYPLGRPVGTTIYPGMQITSVAIWHALDKAGFPMSLNDICVFVPAWFGAIASFLVGLLAMECSGTATAGPFAALVMAVVPAHIMRSVGGGYDNESIAVTAMVATFVLWVRCLRHKTSWPLAFFAGLAYIYMVAAWGGYIFVINMVGAHVAVLILLGRFTPHLHHAYTLFFLVGTAGAVHVPVVGWTPLRSIEQLGPLLVFVGVQVLQVCEVLAKRQGVPRDSFAFQKLRAKVVTCSLAVGVLGLAMLLPTGIMAPLSIRVRGLFIKHMKTGNPLVDSVAEHQPATAEAYWHYLHYSWTLYPAGLALCLVNRTDSKIFLALYGVIAYFFSSKMNRLIILMGPIASCLSGVILGFLCDWVVAQFRLPLESVGLLTADEEEAEAAEAPAASQAPAAKKDKKDKKATAPAKPTKRSGKKGDSLDGAFATLLAPFKALYTSKPGKSVRIVLALALVAVFPGYWREFWGFSVTYAEHTSQPSVVYKAQLRSGENIIVTDYIDAYHWLRDNTPVDARVVSWWDYGYQIAGMGNRTTLADGNTWNLEHIALIARMLTSEEEKAHSIMRHFADYVLVWSGGGGDDLAKSPHIARIGNAVYPDICPKDPMCRSFGFGQGRKPTPSMERSLLYKLTQNKDDPSVILNDKLFREVYTSRYHKVRIYKVLKVSKKSRKWLANPANRLCDRPGSWYCPGQYPPALADIERVGTQHATLNYDD